VLKSMAVSDWLCDERVGVDAIGHQVEPQP
jgi:hypothetical protein